MLMRTDTGEARVRATARVSSAMQCASEIYRAMRSRDSRRDIEYRIDHLVMLIRQDIGDEPPRGGEILVLDALQSVDSYWTKVTTRKAWSISTYLPTHTVTRTGFARCPAYLLAFGAALDRAYYWAEACDYDSTPLHVPSLATHTRCPLCGAIVHARENPRDWFATCPNSMCRGSLVRVTGWTAYHAVKMWDRLDWAHGMRWNRLLRPCQSAAANLLLSGRWK